MRVFPVFLILALLGQGSWAQEKESPTPQEVLIQGHIDRLAAEDFAIRKRAHEALLLLGEPAVTSLKQASKSDSPERRKRARLLLVQIRERWFTKAFTKLASQPEEEMDLEHGMYLIARFVDASVRKDEIYKTLDALVEKVRQKFGKGKKPGEQPPERVIEVLIEVLSDEFGLSGDHNLDTYDHPLNSSIHHALTKKKGLPIILSEITAAVARRLDVPVVGIPIPGRYMFKYDGSQAPKGHPKDDIIVDPHGGWGRVSFAELRHFPLFQENVHLEPASVRLVVIRMLTNLQHDLRFVGRLEDSERVGKWVEVMLPDDPE